MFCSPHALFPCHSASLALKVACGHSFSAVVTKSGDIWTWGAGESGQLGSGRCTFRELPTKVNMESRNAEASRSDSASGEGIIDKGLARSLLCFR